MKHFRNGILPCLTIVLAGLLLPASPASAEVKVYVTNCMHEKGEQKFYSFNGKDSACSTAYDTASPREQVYKALTCKGQGKGRCKITMSDSDLRDCGDQNRVNVDRGETLVVLNYRDGNIDLINDYFIVDAERANCCGDTISDDLCDDRYDNCTAWDFSTSECADYLKCMYEGGTSVACGEPAQ